MNPDSSGKVPTARSEAQWYGDGLRFACTQCGNCCSGPAGFVWVDDDEVDRLARGLQLSVSEFRTRFTRLVHGRTSLTERRTEFGLDCVFLDRSGADGRATCGVYADRPSQCRTFPFWPENLRSPRDWQRTGRTCPGLNTGRLVPIKEIRVLRDMATCSGEQDSPG